MVYKPMQEIIDCLNRTFMELKLVYAEFTSELITS